MSDAGVEPGESWHEIIVHSYMCLSDDVCGVACLC